MMPIPKFCLLTPRQACALLQVHRNTLRRLIQRGQVRAINLSSGRRPTWRILADSLENIDDLAERIKLLDLEQRLGL